MSANLENVYSNSTQYTIQGLGQVFVFRVAVYIRVSDKKLQTGHDKVSLIVQQRDILEFCKKNGWIVHGIYEDTLTGALLFENRVGGKRLISDAENGLFNLIIVWDTDRIGRAQDGISADVFRHKMRELGIQVYSIGQPHQLKSPEEYLENPYSDDAQILIEKIADWQSASTITKFIKRSVMGKIERIKSGRMITTPAYGHKMEPVRDEKGNIVIRRDGRILYKRILSEAEAPIVVRVFNEYKNGASQNEIAKGLNDDKIPTRRGKPWERATIGRILSNPIYYGEIVYNKHYRRKSTVSGNSKWGTNPKEKWILVPPEKGEVPGIILKELFDEVQATRERKNKMGAYAIYGDYLFSGLLKCTCGSNMYRRKITSYYKHRTDDKVTKSSCNGYICGRFARFKDRDKNYISEKDLKEAVLNDLKRFKDNPLVLQGFLEENGKRDTNATNNELAGVKSRLSKVGERYKRLRHAYEIGVMNVNDFDEAVGELRDEETSMRQAVTGLEQKAANEEQRDIGRKDFENAINNFEAIFNSSDIKQEKRFLRELVDNIVVGDGKIVINYLIGSK